MHEPSLASPLAPGAPAWLADLLPAPLEPARRFQCRGGGPGRGPAPALALATAGLGERRELARTLGLGAELGVDLVHAAVNELLALGALPRALALAIEAADDAGLAEAVVAGVVRAARGHDLECCGTARAPADCEHVSVALAGDVVAGSPTPAPGDAVLALRGHGPLDADCDWALERAQERGLALGERLAGGDRLGHLLASAAKSFFSVLHGPLRQDWPARRVAVGAPGLLGSLAKALPAGVGAELELGSWPAPAPFGELMGAGGAAEAAARCSLGCGMLLLVPADDAPRWLAHTQAWNEPARAIGRLVAGGGVAVAR